MSGGSRRLSRPRARAQGTGVFGFRERCHGAFFRDSVVVVVGGGDSAMEGTMAALDAQRWLEEQEHQPQAVATSA